MKFVFMVPLLLGIAACKHEKSTMMLRCYNCDIQKVSEPEVNLELNPANKDVPAWQNPSQEYLALAAYGGQ